MPQTGFFGLGLVFLSAITQSGIYGCVYSAYDDVQFCNLSDVVLTEDFLAVSDFYFILKNYLDVSNVSVSYVAGSQEAEENITKNVVHFVYWGFDLNKRANAVIYHTPTHNLIHAFINTVTETTLMLKPNFNGYILYRLADDHLRNSFYYNGPSRFQIQNRRSNPGESTVFLCDLVIVVDYDYFADIAHKDRLWLENHLYIIFHRMNSIFLNSDFNDKLQHSSRYYGFRFSRLIVHEQPQQALNNGIKNLDDLFEAFTKIVVNGETCQSLLLTARLFSQPGRMGMSFLGCSSGCYPCVANLLENAFCHRVVITRTNRKYTVVSEQMLERIFAHELAHGWGAEHDNDEDQCGDNFIMSNLSVDGVSEFHDAVFSQCSLGSFARCVARHVDKCFHKIDTNSLVSQVATKSCSPYGHACCTQDSRIAPSGVPCSTERFSHSSECRVPPVCDGVTRDCPTTSLPANESAKCFEHGICREGVCVGPCQMLGLEQCFCPDLEHSCTLCCRDISSSACQPLQEGVYWLSDQRPCPGGYCSQGQCLDYEPVNEPEQSVTSTLDVFRWLLWLLLAVFSIFYVLFAHRVIFRTDERNRKNQDKFLRQSAGRVLT